MGGLNLEKMITPIINSIVNRKNILIYLYQGQIVDANGDVAVGYAPAFAATAQVQLTTQQTLEHIDAINLTKIYKDFRIQSTALTGLNRNLNTGGDFIQMDGLFYKIVALPENFETGWVWVVGVQSTDFNG